jgi:hypothetical protein
MADEPMGPISYLIVEFPQSKMTGEGMQNLVELADRGLVRILDLQFVSRGADGSIVALSIADLDGDGTMDLAVFEGVSSGLLDETDFADAASAIEPGASAAILIFENRWAIDFVSGIRRGGGQLVAAGYIPQDAILASLDATD